MVKSIAQEIGGRKDYLNEKIGTIYFGGGTPSLCSQEEIEHILNAIHSNFHLDDQVEITLEANPEDLKTTKAAEFYRTGINRLSIGIQTFDESRLYWMNRAHNSNEAREAYENARVAGFKNISLDLIYAIPDHSQAKWESDLRTVTGLKPEHISLYGLTIEDRTVFGEWEQQNKLVQVPKDEAANQYLFAIDFLKSESYLQYEVSNFGKEGFYSCHNNAYWSGVPYLGVGPGAHSFNGGSRRFNVRSNLKYLNPIRKGNSYYEVETLTKTQRVNEQILTQLRTARGLALKAIEKASGEKFEQLHSEFIHDLKQQNLIKITNDFLSLKPKGFLVADEIALRLFFPECPNNSGHSN